MRTDTAPAPAAVAGVRPPSRLASAWSRPGVRLAVLAAAVLVLAALYLFTAVPGSLGYAVKIRSVSVAGMVVVAVAVGVSTVVFHTITQNRILTPSIMGFDAFFMLISTVIVFGLGATTFLRADPVVLWLVQVAVMTAFSVFLFTWLFGGKRRSIHLMLLVGIVLGTFFRSLTEWMQRMLDPLDFQVLTDTGFASLTRPNETLLLLTGILVALGCLGVVPLLRTLDVLTLGEPTAVGLGVDHRRVVMALFAIVSVMVAASTALVGPILFFGLIVANLAYSYAGTFRHRFTLPAAALLGVVCLLGGQLLLERVLGFGGSLSMVIEFAGGLFFLFLVLRKGAR
ncbi:iron chelate uptake ABC transporter family permease subunit [Microbacterium sp. zg.Y1090]|uniref:iron chelate uptake ABC transporter family permease subunit n=1 Tax=Microbacterium TaxID=33882 RepID=UPI00214BF4C9|nr:MULTISPECIES: iron chelate uptake ABC transporter family permease subunit [unclassified Microbacterium]MCR2812485.1 iron chelate uptake ABC transporter family permease subunit [Microbacterium sp. zg.Y1084]MCR2817714.1 iron chelate uptake ABC transporter family permease subunit [Microbacterium sp. zg.Y1090]MDL5485643.1 iron chelate uptake ABC transporter family permease subunit [Microbacterium sp. zg-Y1211]WIM28814.1 iron chelate uptake ABC transporter family permease subunit [Microbacterium 